MKIYNIGIIGCGSIAAKMAATLGGMKGVKRYAVASRTVEKQRLLPRNGSLRRLTEVMKNWLPMRKWI